MMGKHLISHWSRTQATVALSSGEAEMNASLKAGCEGLFLKTVMGELQGDLNLKLFVDSSASIGILQREGNGSLKHIEVRRLWLQERVGEGKFELQKIPRSENCGDALTHHWSSEASGHYARMGLERVTEATSSTSTSGKECK